MVQGKFFGSFHLVAPVATNSCGTFFAFMYLWIAELGGVPSGWNISSTLTCSTSLRAISTVLGGLKLAVALVLIIGVLTVKPSGFFGKVHVTRV